MDTQAADRHGIPAQERVQIEKAEKKASKTMWTVVGLGLVLLVVFLVLTGTKTLDIRSLSGEPATTQQPAPSGK
jgi:hypothetical protein